MATFRSTPLFGGALIVDLPSTFADVRYVFSFYPLFSLQANLLKVQSVKSQTTKKSTLTKTASQASSSTSLSVLASQALGPQRMAQR